MHIITRTVTIVAVLAALLGVAPPALAGNGQRPETITEHQEGFTDTFTDVFCINGAPEEAEISIVEDGVFHGTFFQDGRYHVTGTFVGRFFANPTNPALPNYTGTYTVWFGENNNKNVDTSTFTFRANGSADDGSKAVFGHVEHLTAGVITWTDDGPVLTDARSEVSHFRCK